jgi:pimeloyl-ACP methyl ester carboxylesterase
VVPIFEKKMMATPPTIYKSPADKAKIMAIYEAKLAACQLDYEERDVATFAGKTHVIVTGPQDGPAVLLLHGINAGAPLALEAMRDLTDRYRIYAVDTVGQATKSAETRLSVKDNSYGKWLDEVMQALGLPTATVIGVSYGAFLLQRLIAHAPRRVSKAIFVVPGGVVNGSGWRSLTELFIPLIRYNITKKEAHLVKFMHPFYNTKDAHSIAMQGAILLGVKMDYARPPLLKAAEVADFQAPVYAMVAEDDIFFPGLQALERLKSSFKNFKASTVLKGAKHIPDQADYPKIAQQLDVWMRE